MSTTRTNLFTDSHARDCRAQFPALERTANGRPVVFFDGPAGTQVPQRVAEAMSDYLLHSNANHGGLFGTSVESDRRVHEAHAAFAQFVGAQDPDEIVFGQNMTSLTFSFSRAISQTWNPGDEIVVTALDHDANISPWLLAARDRDVKVNWVKFNPTDFTLDLDDLSSQLSERTRLVAVGCASNATGGVNPVKRIASMAHDVGALVYLDAVHFGPHGLIDVVDWDCDFLVCSAYKFFGPHLGVFWGRRRLLESIEAYRVRPVGEELPGKWMTGTQSHESIVGGLAGVDYLADLGRQLAEDPKLPRRNALEMAFLGIRPYEQELSKRLLRGLQQIDGIRIWGATELDRLDERFPTMSITHDAISATQLAGELAKVGIYVWHGHYYALEFVERLGLQPEGMVRIGLVHYNTPAEVDRLLAAIETILTTT